MSSRGAPRCGNVCNPSQHVTIASVSSSTNPARGSETTAVPSLVARHAAAADLPALHGSCRARTAAGKDTGLKHLRRGYSLASNSATSSSVGRRAGTGTNSMPSAHATLA